MNIFSGAIPPEIGPDLESISNLDIDRPKVIAGREWVDKKTEEEIDST